MSKTYHLFISHSWDYGEQYEKLKKWLDEDWYLQYNNYSVPIDKSLDVNNARELREKLKNRISLSSCVIILSGMYATYSEWIDFEIDTAIELNKPIIGVVPWGQERIPEKIQKSAMVMVGWNSGPIIDAIKTSAI